MVSEPAGPPKPGRSCVGRAAGDRVAACGAPGSANCCRTRRAAADAGSVRRRAKYRPGTCTRFLGLAGPGCDHPAPGCALAVVSRLVGFPEYWRNLRPWVKGLFWGLIGLGGICVMLGFYGDSHKFWQNWSFGANFFSSFAGALFGIPFAAILITWFTSSQERRMAQGPVETLSQNAWSEFKSAVRAHAEMMPFETLRESTKVIADSIVAIRTKVAAANARNPDAFKIPSKRKPFEWGVDEGGNGYAEDYACMSEHAHKISSGVLAITSRLEAIGSSSAPYNRAWASARNRWQFLNTTVRTMRLSADLDWDMPEGPERDFVFRFNAEASPIHRTVTTLTNTVHPVIGILVQGLQARDTPAELVQHISETRVRNFDAAGFAREGAAAATILEDLTRELDEVDAAGWPQCPHRHPGR